MTDCYANWAMLLEYLKVAFSWPTVTLVVVLLLAKRFQAPVAGMLARVKSWKGWGTEVELGDGGAQQIEAAKKPADENEDLLTQNSNDPVRARNEILRLWRLYNFERYFNVIFGTQMRLLEHLRKMGQTGEQVTELERFYTEHQTLAGESQSTQESYIAFLKQTELIEFFVDGDVPKARISETGIMFLAYILQTYGLSAGNRLY